jgi:mannose-6-phosphate isomerase class I
VCLFSSGCDSPVHTRDANAHNLSVHLQRWLLYPPKHQPVFDPNAAPVEWLKYRYPKLRGRERALLEECDIGPGEVLYFPSGWWHAVVNVGETVFVSSFEKQQAQQNSGVWHV